MGESDGSTAFPDAVSQVGDNLLEQLVAVDRHGRFLTPDTGVVVQQDVDVLGLDDALNRLAVSDPIKARLVELRYFAGLSVAEVAEITGTSPATVKRQWAVTKAWLYHTLSSGAAS